MITKLSHATVWVVDQDRAKAFYTEKLGFEVRDDVRMGTFRWLTVGPKTQPDLRIVLMRIGSGPNLDEAGAAQLRGLVERGALGGGVVECDDIQKTYEELSGRGVEFASPPKQMPYGIEAVFKDDSGNFFSLGQKK
jgi:catechol 2,3-dioxygenase-like lactoylglutathione lyase family enzyme